MSQIRRCDACGLVDPGLGNVRDPKHVAHEHQFPMSIKVGQDAAANAKGVTGDRVVRVNVVVAAADAPTDVCRQCATNALKEVGK